MLKVENIRVFGIVDALRGMRNPLNSWQKNDSSCKYSPDNGSVVEFNLGPNDRKLCEALVHGGMPHRKFLRQIPVSMDITAPTYWWAEMDTYKVSTTRNSCSIQHKGSSRDFETSDFTLDMVTETISLEDCEKIDVDAVEKDMEDVLEIVNHWRRMYVDTGNYTYFRLMRQFLPMGYNYKATWSANYEVLLNVYEWRRNHKLREWHAFCDEIENLPGMDVFLAAAKKEERS